MRTVIFEPSNSQFLPATFRFVFPIFPRAQLDSCLMQAAPLHQTISDCRSTSRRDSTSCSDAAAPVC